jgi:Type IV secretion-system coupling protein DNA-binding domain
MREFIRRSLKDIFGESTIDIGRNEYLAKPSHFAGIYWGGTYLPHEAANTHFCFVGATGSGKTISIRLLLQTVLPFVVMKGKSDKWLDHRALVYDPKGEMIPYIKGMQLKCAIKSLHPFQDDGYAWDMAKDITERAHAQEFATILIPLEQNSQQPFFGDAARHLLEGVITSLMLTSGESWTFRDVIYAMGTKERIAEILDQSDETRELITLYFEHQEVAKNIMSTVATKLKAFKIIAALWEDAIKKGRTISLTDWLMTREERKKTADAQGNGKTDFDNYILVLGNDETARTAIDAINQAIFKRVAQLILNQRDIDTRTEIEQMVKLGTLDRRRHWIILDEVRDAGKLDGLTQLMIKGRSRGAAIVLGFQDIDGLRAVYGEKEANEIIGQCSNYAVLRIQNPETAKWASSLFGETEVMEEIIETNSSYTWSQHNSSTSGSSTRVAYREVKELTTGQIIYIKPTNKTNGLTGYYLSSHIDEAYGHTIPGDALFPPSERTLLDVTERFYAKRRDKDKQKLETWSDGDRSRLGFRITRRQKIEQYKEKEKKAQQVAEEIAALATYEKRPSLTPKEIEELVSISEEALKICQQLMEENSSKQKKEAQKTRLPENQRRKRTDAFRDRLQDAIQNSTSQDQEEDSDDDTEEVGGRPKLRITFQRTE